jgi:thiamine pyrophosphate-dependent acetolactate synthase large subunit-like protein
MNRQGTPPAPRSGADALADALAAEGVTTIFGLLGDGNLHFMPRLVDTHGVRFVSTRHEAASVVAADAYSRATGQVGVCTVTHGPGLTNAASPLMFAERANARIVLIAGDTARDFREHGQNFEQEPFILACGAHYEPVEMIETLSDAVRFAFRHAALGRGPVVLNVPTDVQHAQLPTGWAHAPSGPNLPAPQRPVPDPEAIARAAELVRSGSRPAIIAGRGAVAAGAKDALLELGDRIGAVLATSLLAKDWFAGEPWNLGISGGFSHELANEILSDVDVVLAFGASLNLFTVGHGAILQQARFVHVTTDPAALGETTPVDVGIVADARSTAEALLAALPQQPGLRTPELEARIAGYDPLEGVTFTTSPRGADLREVSRICDEALPRDRTVVVGIGHFMGYPTIHTAVPGPGDLFLPWEFGPIGQAVPHGIGVAVARPGQTTVVYEGDGSLMASLAELETAARHDIPLLVIVLDDGAFGAETYVMEQAGIDPALSFFENPDFAAVAKALGLEAYSAATADELREVLPQALPVRKPTLIRVAIGHGVWHHEIFRDLTG